MVLQKTFQQVFISFVIDVFLSFVNCEWFERNLKRSYRIGFALLRGRRNLLFMDASIFAKNRVNHQKAVILQYLRGACSVLSLADGTPSDKFAQESRHE